MINNSHKIIITGPKVGEERGLLLLSKTTWLDTYPNKEHNITKKDILSKNFISKERLFRWRNTIKNSGKKNIYICVAKDGKKNVGFCVVSKRKNFNKLNTLYVLPEYQGMGIGTKLLDKSIKWLNNDNKIFVWVVSYNKKGINFYKKYGFIETGRTSNKRRLNGKVIPETQLVLVKPLS
jgi:ribosomal protein S18 acetylase RimI-like enzyme